MVDYYEYKFLHPILQEVLRDNEDKKFIHNRLLPVFQGPKLFYLKSEAVINFLEEVIPLVEDPELLVLMYKKIEVPHLKLKLALKIKSEKLIIDVIESPYYFLSHHMMLQLLEYPNLITPEILSKAMDNLEDMSIIVSIASDIIELLGNRVFEVLMLMKNEDMKEELIEIILKMKLLDEVVILQKIDIIRMDVFTYAHIIGILDSNQLREEFYQEVSTQEFRRFEVLQAMISACKDTKFKAEMRLILPNQYLQDFFL